MRFYCNKPVFVAAPMVDFSILPFRLLCRKYGIDIAYTPMLHSRLFSECQEYRSSNFVSSENDSPLVAQFCSNDPDLFVSASKFVEDKVIAVDLNLGCPMGIARKGNYGAYLQDQWGIISNIVKNARKHLSVPISCKIRIQSSVKESIQYAQMLEESGCQVLTVHGRTRDNKGKHATPADWSHIAEIKKAIGIPVIANGSVHCRDDAFRCLEQVQCNGVMVGEALLKNPSILSEHPVGQREIALEYLDVVNQLCGDDDKNKVYHSRGHMFRMIGDSLSVSEKQSLAVCHDFDEMRSMVENCKL